jgi:hypothetical protein
VPVAVCGGPAFDGDVVGNRVGAGIALVCVVEVHEGPWDARVDDGDRDPDGPSAPEPRAEVRVQVQAPPIELTIVRESFRTGSAVTGLFQTLVSGKTGQFGAWGSGCAAAEAASASGTRAVIAARAKRTISCRDRAVDC